MSYNKFGFGLGINDNAQQNRGRAWQISRMGDGTGAYRSTYAVHMFCMLCQTKYQSHSNGVGKRRCPNCQRGRPSLAREGDVAYSGPKEKRRVMSAADVRAHLHRAGREATPNLSLALAAYDKKHGNETSPDFNRVDRSGDSETSQPPLWQQDDVDVVDQHADEPPMSKHWGDTGHDAKAAEPKGVQLLSRDDWEKRFDQDTVDQRPGGIHWGDERAARELAIRDLASKIPPRDVGNADAIMDDDGGADPDESWLDEVAACGRMVYLNRTKRAAQAKQWPAAEESTRDAWRAAAETMIEVYLRYRPTED